MIHPHPPTSGLPRALCAAGLLTLGALAGISPAWAALAELSSVPLGTLAPQPPRVNLMFILDDSGSMANDYVPENTSGGAAYTGLCFGYAPLNKVFYNPNTTYVLPPLADVAAGNFAAPSFSAAPTNGFSTTSGKTNLSTSVPQWTNAGRDSKGNLYAYYYTTYSGTGTTTDCSKLTPVTSVPVAQQTNYAIWYSFYRNRTLMMKSASARALAAIDPTKYRVGFSTINETGTSDTSTRFQNVGDFDALVGTTNKTYRTTILEKLYKAPASGSTPLRPALVKAGVYYATKATSPIQYSCQRNYALLTTDGYWNTAREPENYIPFKLDGITKFDPGTGDSGAAAPYKDAYPYTLADIAYYYYTTDLRADMDDFTKVVTFEPLKTENVPQRMNTITLGLGLSGTLAFRADYTDEDLAKITWPNPKANPTDAGFSGNTVIERIDDLWHAAVNGRGRYYAASDPNTLVTSLKAALESANLDTGAAAAASVSALAPTGSNDKLFAPVYEYEVEEDGTVKTPWQGDVRAYTMTFKDDVATIPALTKDNATWSAQKKLDERTAARRILFNSGKTLVDFTYANMSVAERALFDGRCDDTTALADRLSQCANFTGTDGPTLKAKVTGNNLVEFLRGTKTLQMDSTVVTNRIFRRRVSVLGDIVNSSPVFVGRPPFRYTDAGYTDFIAEKKDRTSMVYVGANDGMLHAFNGETGVEEWAYVPTKVIPNLWRLADAKYDTDHRAYVDATPTLADVYDGKNWRTLLVGGLGGGGNQFYALDVTSPTDPKLLWEFTDADDKNLGLSFGNPIVTKLHSVDMDKSTGENPTYWAAIFTSGYNNVGGTGTNQGDGHGYLYVLDVVTGERKATIATPSDGGTTTTPSNLAKINSWIHSDSDNQTRRVYGGDMLGNLWRFDVDGRVGAAGKEAVMLGKARAENGKIQPITTRPLLTALGSRPRDDRSLISFGTGKYLHANDLNDYDASSTYSNTQSLYFVMDDPDKVATGSSASLRSNNVVQRTATVTTDKIDYTKSNGFYLDLPETRERMNLDGIQFNGILTFASTVPNKVDRCKAGGHSNLYYFTRFGEVQSIEQLSVLAVGGSRFFNQEDGAAGDGSNGGKIVWTGADGKTYIRDVSSTTTSGDGKQLRRAGWREIID